MLHCYTSGRRVYQVVSGALESCARWRSDFSFMAWTHRKGWRSVIPAAVVDHDFGGRTSVCGRYVDLRGSR
jgi:hypothetical protein